MRVIITVVAGPHQGQVFRFSGHDTFLVGRSKRAHFRLPEKDEYFSRLHFMIEINPPVCRLIDMGSTNGTYVNKQKVSAADLKDGDMIQGGQTSLRVTVETDDEVATRHFDWSASPASPPVILPPAAVPPAAVPPAAARVVPDLLRTAPTPDPAGGAFDTAVPSVMSMQMLQPFPGYRIVQVLGQGGMGIVYLAERIGHGPVALKTIRPAVDAGADVVGRFLREVEILRQLNHPNIVGLLDHGESNGDLYFAMDYLDGVDAATLCQRDGRLPVGRAVGLLCQLIAALGHAHARGFVHRDVKPANIMIVGKPGAETVKLLDFGLARTYQASRLSGLTVTGSFAGTVPFMAPEQVTNFREARPTVDQYAAAASLYWLLSGQFTHDYPADFRQRLLILLQADPVPLDRRVPGLPPGLVTAIHRGLRREPADRFPDVDAFGAALRPFAGKC